MHLQWDYEIELDNLLSNYIQSSRDHVILRHLVEGLSYTINLKKKRLFSFSRCFTFFREVQGSIIISSFKGWNMNNKGVSSLQMETDILVLPLGKGKAKPQGFSCGKWVKTNTQKFASYWGNKPKYNHFWHTTLNTANFVPEQKNRVFPSQEHSGQLFFFFLMAAYNYFKNKTCTS